MNLLLLVAVGVSMAGVSCSPHVAESGPALPASVRGCDLRSEPEQIDAHGASAILRLVRANRNRFAFSPRDCRCKPDGSGQVRLAASRSVCHTSVLRTVFAIELFDFSASNRVLQITESNLGSTRCYQTRDRKLIKQFASEFDAAKPPSNPEGRMIRGR